MPLLDSRIASANLKISLAAAAADPGADHPAAQPSTDASKPITVARMLVDVAVHAQEMEALFQKLFVSSNQVFLPFEVKTCMYACLCVYIIKSFFSAPFLHQMAKAAFRMWQPLF